MSATVPVAPPKTLIELRGISHEYAAAGREGELVLKDINLEVAENDVITLLGPSGCGKSTLIRIVAGLIQPTRGEALWRGQPLHGVCPGVAMVFQNFALFPWLTVRENVLLPIGHLPPAEQQPRLERALATVGLSAYEHAHPREISGGMKQRVGIARALIAEPAVLCMDEPFSALDVLTAETLRNDLARLLADPNHPLRTMVMITHGVSEAVFFATKIVVLAAHPGRIDVVLPVNLPYPRDPESPEFRGIVAKLHAILTHTHLPDAPVDLAKVVTKVDETRRHIAPVSLPYVTPGEVLGLLSVLGEHERDVFELAERLQREFTAVVSVVKASELLGLVETPGQEVHLTALGHEVLKAPTKEQRRLIRERLLKLKVFELLTRLIRVQENQALGEDDLVRELQVALPHEKTRPLFRTLLSWGRYAELIAYDQPNRVIRLYERKSSAPVRTG